MTALQINFVAGRFHANPWHRGADEGEIEWPPSPWRLLCAIVGGWNRSGVGKQETLLRVLDALSQAPTYNLPIAASGHTRHYGALGGVKNAAPERTLMLDSFIALERGREHGTNAFVIWQSIELDPDERRLLDRCCAAVRYLGGAKSPCEVSVVDAVPWTQDRYRVDVASREDGEGPIVRRLAAAPSLRGIALLRALQELPVDMRRASRTLPPGTAWIDYRLPPDFGWAGEQVLQRDSHPSIFPATILRFAIDAEGGVLPPITEGVTVAEKMRQAAIKRHSAATGSPASKRLSGKCDDGSDRRQGHDHPFFLPLDLRDRGVVDGLDVWLPAGCTHDEFRALTSISDIWDNVILAGRLAVTYLGRVEPVCASQWSTVTPVILDRFPKRRGVGGAVLVDAPTEQLRRALERRSLPNSKIEIWSPRRTIAHRLGGHTRLDAFRRARIGDKTVHPVVGATITFDRPVAGPIVVGRLAHFGLGQFRPA